MAKVKILESCAGPYFSYAAGQIIEENEYTQGLINGGGAVKIEEPKEKSAAKKDK